MILRPGVFLQNRYEILDLIGSGGMSEVYRARCHKLNRYVAIKVLKKEFISDDAFVRKFKMEAQAAGALIHPNIVNYYDVVDEDDLHYIVMELVEGITLKNYIDQKGRLETDEAVDFAIKIAEGLKAAHSRGIIHRDVKPQNVILAEDHNLKVADFGIARAVTAQTASTSQAMGSVHYISPEQAKGEFTDERSDIYSLGITMYEMLTGKLPFTGDTAVSVALAHVNDDVTPPSVYNPTIPVGLEQVILKCMEKDADRRYQDADSLISDLQYVLAHPGETPPGVAGEDPGKGTKVISRKDLTSIRNSEKSRQSSRKKQDKKEADEHDDSGLNHLLLGAAAVLVIAVLAAGFFLLSQLGLIGSGPEPETTAAVETTLPAGAISEKECYMPYIIGLSQEDAEAKLSENGLTLSISDRQYSEQFAENLIMDQKPAAGDVVAKYSRVNVVLSLGSQQIDVSNLGLNGLLLEEAQEILTGNGLNNMVVEEYSDTVEKGRITSYSPAQARKGETVTLAVSIGPEIKEVTVPNLTGSSESAARDALSKLGLRTGNVGRVNSDTVAEGLVISQGPNVGDVVKQGTSVDFVVSAGPSETVAETETAFIVEPIEGDPNSRYVASINNTYELKNLIGPGSASASVTVMIRLRQETGGNVVYKTLMEPRTVTADAILPVRFKAIEGVYGVDTGQVEVVDVENDRVLMSYDVQFFKVQ